MKLKWNIDKTTTKKDVLISTILSIIIASVIFIPFGYLFNFLNSMMGLYVAGVVLGSTVNYIFWTNQIKNKRFSTAFTRKEVS